MSSTSVEKTPSPGPSTPAYSQSPPANGGAQQQPYPANGMQSNPQYQQQYNSQPVQYSAVQPNQVQPYQPNRQAPAGRYGYSGPNYCCFEITFGTRVIAGVLLHFNLIRFGYTVLLIFSSPRLMIAPHVIYGLCLLSWALLLAGAIIYNKWMCIVGQVLLWCLLIIQYSIVFLFPVYFYDDYFSDKYLMASLFVVELLLHAYCTLVVYCFVKYIDFKNAARTTVPA